MLKGNSKCVDYTQRILYRCQIEVGKSVRDIIRRSDVQFSISVKRRLLVSEPSN